ncbi:MAG TPA: hypothetical protein VLA37_06510 [Sphingomonadaceae bacterium]|nr:hypothetical protein [Sphingomonadaceae bacterium]
MPIRITIAVLLALSGTVGLPGPVAAEETAPVAADPYDDLYAAMDETMGTDQMFNRAYQKYMAEFRQEPHMLELERFSPGVTADLGQALRPWIKKQSERFQKRYRPQFMELLHQAYTPEEAVKLAAFYRTREGKAHLTRIGLTDDLEALRPQPRPADGAEPPARKSFLKPAAGHNPNPVPAGPAAPPLPPDPAVVAYLDDFDLRQKEYIYWRSDIFLSRRISALEPDRDIWNGMIAAIDKAAQPHGVVYFGAR